MKYLSLFTGIGGFELGIKNAYEIHNLRPNELADSERPEKLHNTQDKLQQWQCVGYSEIDKYAAKVYQHHFPTHKQYGDITKINADELPDFDLLVGGFPCQAFSIAGKRKGFDDTRGTLFFDIARILRAKQPRLFLLENVKGLLSHDNGNTFKTIISTLDELGYDLQWQVLNSKNHGVPQNRERIFIIGHLRGTRRPEVFPFRGINNSNSGIIKVGNIYPSGFESGNIYSPTGLSPTIKTANPVEGHITNSGCPKIVSSKSKESYYRKVQNFGEQHPFFYDNEMEEYRSNNHLKIRRLTPTECERLQGFPDGWTAVENTSDSQRYKMCGNAVTVNVIRDIMSKILTRN